MLVFLLFVSAGVLIDGVFFPVSIFKSHVQDVTRKDFSQTSHRGVF